jgi:HKD family nuclease
VPRKSGNPYFCGVFYILQCFLLKYKIIQPSEFVTMLLTEMYSMKILTKNLNNTFFNEFPETLSTLKIISPYISKLNVEQLLDKLSQYEIKPKITVITTFERDNFINGASSLAALKLLIEHEISVFALKDLHTKLYIFDNSKCIVGSANFTKRGFSINHELLVTIDEPETVNELIEYTDNLLTQIQSSGNWQITSELIEQEETIIQSLEQPNHPKPTHTWGAELENSNTSETVVLSVSAGDTFWEIINQFSIHAHPIKRGFNYRETNLITFRKKNGGAMSAIYKINSTFALNMNDWLNDVESLNLEPIIKANLINYITARYSGLGFESSYPYKFYLLEQYIPLPHMPRPATNNVGARYYSIETLQNKTIL